jgi:alpha-mannosidase
VIVHMIGNAHLDPVWLWNWQAGSDEAVATFRAAADICDDYEEFVFTRGEAWLYQQVADIAPDVFRRVPELIARGQWHIVGGQFVQPDCNLITEQGWRHQFRRGLSYFEEEFGVRPTLAYNVDSFGHPATLPDLLAELGFRGYLFHRPRPEQVKLPAQTFRWQGSGGAEVIGFRIVPGYNARTADLHEQVMTAVDATDPRLGHAMCFYGVGNHGGGPTRDAVEWILEHRDAFPEIELRFSTPDAFFDAIEPYRSELPIVDYELQHTFPGCYSVMHDIKQRQQRGENLLDQGQRVLSAFGSESHNRDQLERKLADAWDDLLFTSFHDILAGTSIPSAWDSVRAMQGRALINGEEVIHTVTRRWARTQLPPFTRQQIVVVNADSDDWEGVVEAEPSLYFDRWGDRWLSEVDGEPIDHQLVQPEAHIITNRVIFPLRVPARSSVQVLVRDDAAAGTEAPESDLHASPAELGNSELQIELAPSGIGQIVANGRNLLGGSGIGLWLRNDSSDTWGQHRIAFDEPVETQLDGGTWIVEETGPIRVRVRLEATLGSSPLRWTLSLHRDDPRLFLGLEIAFNERLKALQMPIQLAGPVTAWVDGQAGGTVSRETQQVERPLLGWSRISLAEQDVAIVTNDAWSVSVERDRWQWTLLRSPKMAWYGPGEPEIYAGHDTYTDQGTHTFSFQLHIGEGLGLAKLAAAARQVAQPPIVFDRYEGMGVRTPSETWLGMGTGATP